MSAADEEPSQRSNLQLMLNINMSFSLILSDDQQARIAHDLGTDGFGFTILPENFQSYISPDAAVEGILALVNSGISRAYEQVC